MFLIPLLILIHVGFILAEIYNRHDIADILWGPGIALVSWSVFLFLNPSNINFFICILVTIWAVRLCLHIGRRAIFKKEEDKRYLELLAGYGKYKIVVSYFKVFILQGFLMLVMASILIFMPRQDLVLLNGLSYLGLIIFVFGLSVETIADKQLKRFIQNPNNKGKVMTSGLWKYSRHPNYFGEVTLWWGLFIIGLSFGNILGIITPLLITFLILKVSGIPMLEKKYIGNNEFENYKKKTSAFFLWFPKNNKTK